MEYYTMFNIYEVPWVLMVLFGLLLILQGGFLMHEARGEYSHRIAGTVGPDTIAERSQVRVLNYSELSESGKRVFRQSLEVYISTSDNSLPTVVLDENPPPEFSYPADDSMSYFINYNGTYYNFITWDSSGSGLVGFFIVSLGVVISFWGIHHFVSRTRISETIRSR
ncbi:hypothetical protein [Haloarcula marina]|uniref:hypothetical protein n=1 Tax=Haloarcula marina TaxID=2961574 RepID=UPI0020B68095|nr:hypothetical protein [Halomicroarcula marina]